MEIGWPVCEMRVQQIVYPYSSVVFVRCETVKKPEVRLKAEIRKVIVVNSMTKALDKSK